MHDAASHKKISVVIPCYYSENMIGKVVSQTRDILKQHAYDYEFILVNDGSTDGTFAAIKQLCEEDPKVVGVNLAKNFGQHSAIIAGLKLVEGDLVLIMDDDLQTHPSQCIKLIDKAEEGWDVVFAQFPDVHASWWRRLGSRFNDWTIHVLTKRPKDVKSSNYMVIKKYVADEVVKYDGPYVYIQGLIFRTTSNIANVDVQHFDREEGSSGYTMKSLIRLWSTVLNFSMAPLRFASVIGFIMGALGILAGIFLIIRKLVVPSVQLGWSSLMVAILVCSGAIIFFLGVIGEYIGRMFMTSNKAPQYVLRETIDDRPADEH